MTRRDGRKSWGAELPVETIEALKKEAKESDLPQWKVADQALRMYLGLDEGSTEAALERQLEDARKELEQQRQQRQQLEHKKINSRTASRCLRTNSRTSRAETVVQGAT